VAKAVVVIMVINEIAAILKLLMLNTPKYLSY
jgi:hypothetical protein